MPNQLSPLARTRRATMVLAALLAVMALVAARLRLELVGQGQGHR